MNYSGSQDAGRVPKTFRFVIVMLFAISNTYLKLNTNSPFSLSIICPAQITRIKGAKIVTQ